MSITYKFFILKLIGVCNVLMILPSSKYKSSKTIKVFAVLYILFSTVLFVWMNLFDNINDDRMHPIVNVLNILSKIGLHSFSLVIVSRMTFGEVETYQKFQENLWRLNDTLEFSQIKLTKLCYIFIGYFSCMCVIILQILYQTCTEIGCMILSKYLLEMCQAIQLFFLVVTIISFVQCLKFQHESIISKLSEHKKKKTNNISLRRTENIFQAGEKFENIKEIIRLHEEVCDLVDSFNYVFGISTLLVVANAIFNILVQASIFAIFLLNIADGVKQVNATTITIQIINVILSVILPIFLAHECSGVVAEGKKLVATCMSFSNQLPIRPKTYEDELKEKALSILCHQAETRVPQFSAGGFFTIDYTMLGMMIGSLTANMVIILQFMQSNKKRSCEVGN